MSCTSIIRGGLGNNLFIIASGLGIADKLNRNYFINSNMSERNPHKTMSYDCFFGDIPKKNADINTQLGSRLHKIWHVNKSVMTLTEDQNSTGRFQDYPKDIQEELVIIDGYRQTEKYFSHIEDQVREYFSCSEDNVYLEIKRGSAFIHVRRGDYKTIGFLHDLTSYFKRGIASFSNVNQWYVFSDDIEWCKKQETFKGMNFMEGYNEVDTLWMISQCDKGGVCSNSSFSWWGSWLNSNIGKKVIFPYPWFPNGDVSKNKDIYYKGSTVLNV